MKLSYQQTVTNDVICLLTTRNRALFSVFQSSLTSISFFHQRKFVLPVPIMTRSKIVAGAFPAVGISSSSTLTLNVAAHFKGFLHIHGVHVITLFARRTLCCRACVNQMSSSAELDFGAKGKGEKAKLLMTSSK